MLILLSPAKSLDLESPVPTGLRVSQPRQLDRSQELIDVLRTYSPADIASLMDVSDDLAELNAQRFQDFQLPLTRRNARPALFTFDGDAYQGLNPRERLDARDLTEAGKTLRILSGLYGLLRPLDLIQPYRLEMGRALRTPHGRDLYEFWGQTITDMVAQDLASSPGPDVVVNLASQEYAAAVDLDGMDATVVSPRFEDKDRSGAWKVISFHAKRARGMMAGHLITSRARTLKAITSFAEAGYQYAPEASSKEIPVFRRA